MLVRLAIFFNILNTLVALEASNPFTGSARHNNVGLPTNSAAIDSNRNSPVDSFSTRILPSNSVTFVATLALSLHSITP
jgi:hypothetical protein